MQQSNRDFHHRVGFLPQQMILVGLTLLALLDLQATSSYGAKWEVSPPNPALHGRHARLQLVVDLLDSGIHRDVTRNTKYRSLTPDVVQTTSEGRLTPLKDGTGAIELEHSGEKTVILVQVDHTRSPTPWSFREDVQSVMTKTGCNMGACHGAQSGKKGFKLTLRGYDATQDHETLTRQARGRRISLQTPEQSLILLKGTGTIAHGGGSRFDVGSLEYQIVAEWIAEGAAGPRPEDPHITQLEIFPRQATLAADASQQFSVRATYSDGRLRDVTHWAKFNSTVAGVGTVDDHGVVKVTGSGETSITAWFGSKVAVATVTVPYPQSIPNEQFVASPKHNFIDELILAKLQRLHLPPSSNCTDSEFLRRASLDTLGVLPTAAQTEAFLADKSPHKREQLINSLFQRTEYVDYWSYKWGDLLLLNSSRLHPATVWSFSQWIRQAVQSNLPWNDFARSVVTASGSTLENGAAGFFVLHKDSQDMSEALCTTFLGMSIGCAKCHDHPLERWTMDDYYGMANHFARVHQKVGQQEGETVIFTSSRGDVRHPSRSTAPAIRPLDGELLPEQSPADRREHLANWLTSTDNPYFARAIVNRVWANYFGRGLVETVDDLRATNPASNEELLNAVASDFVKYRYDLRHLIRTIMSSAAYQRSSVPLPGNLSDDRFYSRFLMKRMSAEVLLDALSQVTEVPTSFPGYPAGWRALQLPDSNVNSYFLATFGRPAREVPCACERNAEANVTQTLHLSNGETLNKKLTAANGVIERLLKARQSNRDIAQQLYVTSLARHPTPKELQQIETLLQTPSGTAPAEQEAARKAALQDLLWSLLSSKEFLFIQ